MKLNVEEWRKFYLKDICDVEIAKSADIGGLDNGETAFVGRSNCNNGIQGYVNAKYITKGGCISLSMVGTNVAFWQEMSFQASQNIAILRADYLNRNIALFLCSLLNYEMKDKYSYGRTIGKIDLLEMELKLPIQHNTDGTPYIDSKHTYSDDGYVPDWQFMEDYIKSLHHKPLTTKNTVGNELTLKADEWKEFRVGDLFDLKPTKGRDSTELLDGDDISYIGAKKEMNGFMMRCQLNGFEEWVSDGNCIVFVCLGAGSAGYTTYQKDTFIGMSGKTICGYNKNLNPIIGNFLVTILDCERPKYSFGRSWTGDRLKNTIIKLPIQHNADGTPYIDLNHTYSDEGYVPDWEFMENYIKSLPYGDRI